MTERNEKELELFMAQFDGNGLLKPNIDSDG